jgi:hypothetical protein
MEGATSNTDAKEEDRELLIRSRRAKKTREETTIKTTKAKEYTKVEKEAKVEKDLEKLPGTRVVEAADIDDSQFLID